MIFKIVHSAMVSPVPYFNVVVHYPWTIQVLVICSGYFDSLITAVDHIGVYFMYLYIDQFVLA